MSKLLQRLSDAAKSGVYKTSRSDEILAATRGSALRLTRISLAEVSDKEKLFQRLAVALEFPDWFGRNWDALKDCLADLSWHADHGHVLIFENGDNLAAADRKVLVEILQEVAGLWAADGRPFFAVFLNGEAGLPNLYNDRR
jgi:RNAse (barnase) inhibitor barstar